MCLPFPALNNSQSCWVQGVEGLTYKVETELKKFLDDFKKHIDSSKYHSVEIALNAHVGQGDELQFTLFGSIAGELGVVGVGKNYLDALKDFNTKLRKKD